jgi:hypothetical protein
MAQQKKEAPLKKEKIREHKDWQNRHAEIFGKPEARARAESASRGK